ncbi:MAG: alpha/beta fold hydrolase [Bacillota bacterium]
MKLNFATIPNGESLAYRESESGHRPLILVHGNYSSSAHMDVFFENLPSNFKLIAPDLRGFGDSTYHTPIDSLKDFADDLKAFMDRIGLAKADFLGWSLGGGVVLQLAADYPEVVQKSVVIGSVGIKGYPLYQFDKNMEPTDKRIASKEAIEKDPVIARPALRIYEAKDKEALKQLFKNAIFTQTMPSDERFERYAEATFKQRNLIDADYALTAFNMSHEHNGVTEGSGKIDAVRGPVLVIQGKEDRIVSEDQYASIREGLGAKGEYIEFKESGHAPMFDEKDAFFRAVTEFLDRT